MVLMRTTAVCLSLSHTYTQNTHLCVFGFFVLLPVFMLFFNFVSLYLCFLFVCFVFYSRVWYEALPEFSYRRWSDFTGGGVALAGQSPCQRIRSRMWSIGVEQPLAADGRSLCSGYWAKQVGIPNTDISTACNVFTFQEKLVQLNMTQ